MPSDSSEGAPALIGTPAASVNTGPAARGDRGAGRPSSRHPRGAGADTPSPRRCCRREVTGGCWPRGWHREHTCLPTLMGSGLCFALAVSRYVSEPAALALSDRWEPASWSSSQRQLPDPAPAEQWPESRSDGPGQQQRFKALVQRQRGRRGSALPRRLPPLRWVPRGWAGLGWGVTLLSPSCPLGKAAPGHASLLPAQGHPWGWQVAGTKRRVTPLAGLWRPRGFGGLRLPGTGVSRGWRLCLDGTRREHGGIVVPRGHPCSSTLHKSRLKSPPRLPLLLPSGETQKREAGGAGSWWERGRRTPPCPAANPGSARRGISNNKRPWWRPDGFDLMTKQGGLGSLQSLPRGRMLRKQPRCKSELELQSARMLPGMGGLPWLGGHPPAPRELPGPSTRAPRGFLAGMWPGGRRQRGARGDA